MANLATNVREAVARLLPTDARLFVRRQRYRGEGLHCALCNSGVADFDDFGVELDVVHKRQIVGALPVAQDICPVCYGASRARLMVLFLDKVMKLASNPSLRLLHVAPDIGVYYWLRNKKLAHYTACDLTPRRYSIIPKVRQADLTALPFASADFDIVICSHVLEHIPDDHAAMREIHRVLRPNGSALLMVPEATDGGGTDEDLTITDPARRASLYGQWDHVRLYGRADFLARLQGVGFSVRGFDAFAEYPEDALALRLNPRERLWIAQP